MAFKEMRRIFSNEDMSVEYDPGDRESPIMVESDGWMGLDEARRLRDDLNVAIEAIEKLARKV